MNISQPIKPIPILQVGEGKDKKRFMVKPIFNKLKGIGLSLMFRWR